MPCCIVDNIGAMAAGRDDKAFQAFAPFLSGFIITISIVLSGK